MFVSRWRVEIFDLGVPRLDAPAALKAVLALRGSEQGFLIEKIDPAGDKIFLGGAPFEILRVRRGAAVAETSAGTVALPGNPYAALGARLKSHRLEGPAPAFCNGAVGNLDYEMARHLEDLPLKPSPGGEGRLMLFDRIVVFDRKRGRTELFALLPASCPNKARSKAASDALALSSALRRLAPPSAHASAAPRGGALAEMKGRLGQEGFYAGVRRIKEHIRAGDIFQGVLSERFELPVSADASTVYRALAAVEPSPYLFLLIDGEEHLIGASPERLVKVEAGMALNCPIAGTRPRGRSARADRLFERALRRSPKERAEHLMLVDLARNDLGRVCVPGTVKVRELMTVRRLSSVMHLVSEVEGRLNGAGGSRAWETLAASFPAGTVSGAPKIRAMEILAGLEPSPRGFYAGAVVQQDFSGNLDTCITIRALSLRRGRATLQAGAGIVADSRPEREYQEVLNKLRGLRRALALAQTWSS